MVIYFQCERCQRIFIFGTLASNKTLICGSGCGGKLKTISEEEANETVES